MKYSHCLILLTFLFILCDCGTQPFKTTSIPRKGSKALQEYMPQLQAQGWSVDGTRECQMTKGQNLCLRRASDFESYLAELSIPEDHPEKIDISVIQVRASVPGEKEKMLEDLQKIFE